MKKSTFLIPVLLSLIISYYFYKNNTSESSVAYYLDLVFKEAPICIAFYKKDSNNDLSLMYTNAEAVNEMEECMDIILMNSHGSSAFYSMYEPAIIDAYINDDIDILFSKDFDMFEKQILTLQQMIFENVFSFGWATQKLLHVYNHWIAQHVHSFRISYDWMDAHYTDSDAIILSFLDEKYKLYSHGIGYGPTLPANVNNRYANSSRLALDISVQQGAENKLQFIVDECKLGKGSKVLDVGGGWGSFPTFALPLGISVHTLTISTASFDHLQSLSKELNDGCECEENRTNKASENKCECGSLTVTMKNFWEMRDTELGRSMAGTFDAIVLIGTIEHLPYYERLMESAEYYLKPGGYLHVDGCATKLGFTTNYFVQKYIFPGDSAPFHASSYFKAWEKSNFLMVSAHFDRQDYANTIYHWVQNLEGMLRNESHPLSSTISKKSVKIFRLYLWGISMSFQHGTTPANAWRVTIQKPLF